MNATSERLVKLRQQQQQIQDAIRREKHKLAGEERRKDTRRKILVGSVLLNEARKDQELADRIHKLLNSQLIRDDDRSLFDLPPAPGNKPPAV